MSKKKVVKEVVEEEAVVEKVIEQLVEVDMLEGLESLIQSIALIGKNNPSVARTTEETIKSLEHVVSRVKFLKEALKI